MPTSGELGWQAAVFVLKDDNSAELAWDAARTQEHVRAEHHRDAAAFLAALGVWAASVDPSNAFLCIHAHMGPLGIAPTPEGPWTSWHALGTVIAQAVATLWLAGCTSQDALAAWPTPRSSPARSSLLVTTESRPWRQLVAFFDAEVSLESIVPFDEMEAKVRMLLESDEVLYLDASNPESWQPFSPSDEDAASSGDASESQRAEASVAGQAGTADPQ